MSRRRVERVPEHLRDILRAIAQIQKHTDGVTRAEFERNEMMHEAVLLNLHNIGEASRRVLDADPGIAERHLDLELRDAYAMRNRLVHDYDEISFDPDYPSEPLSTFEPLVRRTLTLAWTPPH